MIERRRLIDNLLIFLLGIIAGEWLVIIALKIRRMKDEKELENVIFNELINKEGEMKKMKKTNNTNNNSKEKLKKALEECVKELFENIGSDLKDNMKEKFEEQIQKALEENSKIVSETGTGIKNSNMVMAEGSRLGLIVNLIGLERSLLGELDCDEEEFSFYKNVIGTTPLKEHQLKMMEENEDC